MAEHVPSLDELAAEPARALTLDPATAAVLLARAEGASAVLRVAAARTPSPNGQRPVEDDSPSDRLMSIDEAARIAGESHEGFLRRKRFRPAIVERGHRTRLVDKQKLRRILAAEGI